jgi:large subunit ribosomal protein L25
MATNATLKALKREGTGKGVARKLRQEGRVPAVLYGRDLEALHLSVDAQEAAYLFHSISVDNTIVALDVEGEKGSFQTLVREIQTHPWKATLLHIDFLRIQKGVAVDVDIPVHLVGVPQGVKLDGGILEQIVHELPVRCIPSAIPESIEVDVSALEVNDVLHIYDIVLGEGVELLIPSDGTICSVAPPRLEEEPAEPVEGVLVEGEEPEAEAEGDEGGAEESEED